MMRKTNRLFSFSRFILAGILYLSFTGATYADGILDYGMGKAKRHLQDDSGPPVPAETNGFIFHASFEIDDPERSASGTLTLPNGEEKEFIRVPSATNLFHTAVFDTEAELHDSYPFGVYTFSMNVDGSEYTADVELVETPFPGAPHVTNYDDLQAIDATEPFLVEWAQIPEGTSDDFIFLEIDEYTSPEPGEEGALDGTATSHLVEGLVLEEGTEYEAELYFAGVVDLNTDAVPEALGLGFIGSWTDFSVATEGDPNGDTDEFRITTSTLPEAAVEEPYSVVLEANEPVMGWSVDDPAELPPEIVLDSETGELFGTPTVPGSFSFTVVAVSTTFETAFRELTLTVIADEPPVIEDTTMEEGVFSLFIKSPEGRAVQIEVSTDLLNWTVVTTVQPVDGLAVFQDPDAGEYRAKFYRARWE